MIIWRFWQRFRITLIDTESDISKFTEKTDDNQLIVIFDEAMDAADFLTDEQRADYKAKNRDLVLNSYIPAYAKAGEELEKLRGSANYEGGLCNYSNGGKEYYEALARSKSSTSLSVQEQFDFLNSFISDQVTEMINLYRKDPNIYDEFDSETVDVTSPEDILNQLQNNLLTNFTEFVFYRQEDVDDYLAVLATVPDYIDADR